MRVLIAMTVMSAMTMTIAAAQETAGPPAASPHARLVPRPKVDRPVRRVQVGSMAMPAFPTAGIPGDGDVATYAGGQSLSLQAALYGAITGNPDLIALRNSNVASAESVELARRFPTTLNPTIWIDYRPITLIPPNTFGTGGAGGSAGGGGTTGSGAGHHSFYHYGQNYILLSYRQPVELGHQTTHRYEIAKAAFNQQQWTVVQAELLTLVQTYRFFQTAAYRREKLRVADQLADFNDRLIHSLNRRLEANQVQAADVALAEVENQATRQQVEVARQDYANALTDLHNQIGTPETAGTAEPLGDFILPRNIPELDDQGLIQLALQSRPEIHVARAQVAGACSATNLARGDMRPTPIVGPQWAMDEAGIQYIGLILVSPIPILNSGRPLVVQREADYRRAMTALQQVEQRTITQVKAAVAKWNSANRLVTQTAGLSETLKTQVGRLERLFDANQTDLTKLLQARQRLIQLENAQLDALWQATQAQADLLTALGAPSLIAALHGPPPGVAPAPAPAPAQ